jgi:hypothetical protein
MFGPVLDAAERLLSQQIARDVRLGSATRLSDEERRNLLLRAQVTSGGPPASVIIKKVVVEAYNPDDLDSWDTRRFFSDWAGAAFLSAGHDQPDAPRFYGGDYAAGFFVLEDLGEQRSLVEALLEEDARAAERALVAFSTSLGRLHAATASQLPRFDALLRSINPKFGVFTRAATGIDDRMQQLHGLLEGLGVRTAAGFARDLDEVAGAIQDPGPFLSYIHGDPCPDNVLWNGAELRLIDFEFGGFGHALMDGAYGRMMFPTCWCANRLPDEVVVKMEAAHRTALINGCPEAQDDRLFDAALVRVCGYWLLTTLVRSLSRASEEDRTWGIATLRQRVVARLEAFRAMSNASDQLPALHDAATRLLDVLRRSWPDVPALPLYPAFRQTQT